MEMTDYKIKNGILEKYRGTGGDVNITEGMTGIGNGAFWGCTDLTTVTIPKSLRRIGDKTFEGCGRLHAVELPRGVTISHEPTIAID